MDPVDAWLRERFGLTLANFPAARAAAFRDAMVGRTREAWEAHMLEEVPAALSIPETHFARHPECFDALRAWLMVRRTQVRRPLRVWSAGCATGEEAYQLAALGMEVGGDAVEVFGTDFSADAIERAQRGEYHHWSMRGAASKALTWLHPTADGGVRVDERVRKKVQFRVGTLDSSDHPTDIDAVFCRNVLIYFSDDGADRVLGRLAEALAPGGVLVTAPTDPSPPGLRAWSRVPTDVGLPVRMYGQPAHAAVVGTTGTTVNAPPIAPAEAAGPNPFADAVRKLLAGGA